MLIKYFFTFLFICFAAFLNANMDSLAHHYSDSFAFRYDLDKQFWDPAVSWKNKYIDFNPAFGKIKIKLIFIDIDKPIFLTDGWHLLKAIMLLSIFLSSAVWFPVKFWLKLLLLIALAALWWIVFELTY